MGRSRHPNKEVEAAVAEAEEKGWTFRPLGHWGRIFCPFNVPREGCQYGINGTPRNAEVHAKQIRQAIKRCPHVEISDEDV